MFSAPTGGLTSKKLDRKKQGQCRTRSGGGDSQNPGSSGSDSAMVVVSQDK